MRCKLKGDKTLTTNKIGILTTSWNKNGTYGYNYGAILQGYALVKQLRKLGYEAYDINYISENVYLPMQYSFFKRTWMRLHFLFDKDAVRKKWAEIKNHKNNDVLVQKFVDFIKRNKLVYDDGKFYDINELHEMSSSFYAFITGSDLVWNPYLHKGKNDEGYFLDFVVDGVKRIAYAPSFGITELPDSSKDNLGELLSKFDALSVREESGAKIVKEIAGMDIPVVLDPTMLLEAMDYDEIAIVPENLPEKYIAVYRFGDIDHTIEKIEEIGKKLGLPLVYIPANIEDAAKTRYDLGPSEFVGVIKNAELVISDSFHCTVFAILNKKPFITFYRNMPQPGKDINSRMINLLNMVSLSDRMVKPGCEVDYNELFNINFAEAEETLAKLRKKSLDYLKDALEK